MPLLPEHQKLKDLNGRNETVGDFIEWLNDNGLVIAEHDKSSRLWPTMKSRDTLIANFFEIDTKKLEAEKRQILSEFHYNPSSRSGPNAATTHADSTK